MKRAFNQGVARIVKIQFIIFMSGIGIISHAQAQTQLDSLVQDSVAQVIKSEEIASSIPSDYAELRLAINSEYYPRLQHAKPSSGMLPFRHGSVNCATWKVQPNTP